VLSSELKTEFVRADVVALDDGISPCIVELYFLKHSPCSMHTVDSLILIAIYELAKCDQIVMHRSVLHVIKVSTELL